MKEKILIIGGSGSLGRQLIRDLKGKNYNVSATVGTYYENKNNKLTFLDITEKKQVNSLIKKVNPDIVIVTAAKTNVEQCELDKTETFNVNVNGLKNVIESCKDKKIVFYSTDTVFDGTKRIYQESDILNPINHYGESKRLGEVLMSQVLNHLICRSSRYYSLEKHCPKYINTLINHLEKGQEVKVPINTPGNFTFIPDISNATIQLLEKGNTGIYHVAGADVYTLCEAALKIAEVFKFNPSLIVPVGENYFNGKVKRPCSPLSIAKLNNEGIKMRTLEEGLNIIKTNYNNNYN
jgi:dTDP-4-dehydrorhamnose reductase